MRGSWVPRVLRPDFTWPQPMRDPIAETTPPTPPIPNRLVRRVWGSMHRLLYHFSKFYCFCFDVPFDAQIIQLPFGLVLKWTGRNGPEEAVAMQMARSAGMPVPKMLCCGEHPASYNRRTSILMTRLPGMTLENSYDPIADDEGPWLEELQTCLQAMRLWRSPLFNEKKRICSAAGTAIRSSRVPDHIMGPFENEAEMHEYLLRPASSHAFESTVQYEETLSRARKILQRPHRIVFTHGDFKAHNILMDDEGHLSGFLDWESAGWYPEYWEFATAMRFGKNTWWYQVASLLGGDQYLEDLDSDKALNKLTVDSYIAF